MARAEHIAELQRGNAAWNSWRRENPDIVPNLCQTDLRGAFLGGANLCEAVLEGANLSEAGAYPNITNLCGANLSRANLRGANLSGAFLGGANLCQADLTGAYCGGASLVWANLSAADLSAGNLFKADLSWANCCRASLSRSILSEANLCGANLSESSLSMADLGGAYLTNADLSGADLNNANLTGARLIGTRLWRTNLERATLSKCLIYGVAVWDAELDQSDQRDLVIAAPNQPTIEVDGLELAQLIRLLFDGPRLGDTVDAFGKKVVLILGRFLWERKVILEAIREALRHCGYVPIYLDCEIPRTRNLQDTIVALARLSRFIIADISDPRSIPQELARVVPTLPSVPVQPLLQIGREPSAMYANISSYDWVLPLHAYSDQRNLTEEFDTQVVATAESKARSCTDKQASSGTPR